MMGVTVLALAVAGLGYGLWRQLRNRLPDPRRCDRCGGERVLLDEESEDPHLDEGQQHEERLGTADYNVWWCGACERGQAVRHALRATSRNVTCEQCGKYAAHEVTKTVAPATHAQGGEFQIRVACSGCGHQQQFWRYTPRVR
jgi:uncharacterized protein